MTHYRRAVAEASAYDPTLREEYVAAVAVTLGFGIRSLYQTGPEARSHSNKLMRLRVALQALAVILLGGVVLLLWTSAKLTGLVLLIVPAIILPIVSSGRSSAVRNRTHDLPMSAFLPSEANAAFSLLTTGEDYGRFLGPVTAQAIRSGFALVELPGRFQMVPGQPALAMIRPCAPTSLILRCRCRCRRPALGSRE